MSTILEVIVSRIAKLVMIITTMIRNILMIDEYCNYFFSKILC